MQKLICLKLCNFILYETKNTKYSESILKNVTEITNHLFENQLLGRPHEIDGLRVIVIMDYTISSDSFEILLFWDTRRDPKELELSLKKLSF